MRVRTHLLALAVALAALFILGAILPTVALAQGDRMGALGIQVREGRRPVAGIEVRLRSEDLPDMPAPPPATTDAEGRAQVWGLLPGLWRIDLVVDGKPAYTMTARVFPDRRAEELGSPARDIDAPNLRWRYFKVTDPPPASMARPTPPPPRPRTERPEPRPAPEPAPAEPVTEDAPAAAPAPSTPPPSTPQPSTPPPSTTPSTPPSTPPARPEPATPAASAAPAPPADERSPEPYQPPSGKKPQPAPVATPTPAEPEAAGERPPPEPYFAPPEAPTERPAPDEAPLTAPGVAPPMPAPAPVPEPEPEPEDAVVEPPPQRPAPAQPPRRPPVIEPPPVEAPAEEPPPVEPEPFEAPAEEPPSVEAEPVEAPAEELPADPVEVPPAAVEPRQPAPEPAETAVETPAPAEPEPTTEPPMPADRPASEEPAVPEPAMEEPAMGEPPALVAEAPAPLPVEASPPRFGVRSGGGGECAECRDDEVAASVERDVAPGARPTGAECGPGMAAAALSAARRAASAEPAPLDGGELASFTEPGSSCQLFGVVLPAGVRYRGYEFAVSDGGEWTACRAERECPVAGASWPARPVIEELAGGGTMVYGVFRNASPDRVRRARLTAYYIP